MPLQSDSKKQDCLTCTIFSWQTCPPNKQISGGYSRDSIDIPFSSLIPFFDAFLFLSRIHLTSFPFLVVEIKDTCRLCVRRSSDYSCSLYHDRLFSWVKPWFFLTRSTWQSHSFTFLCMAFLFCRQNIHFLRLFLCLPSLIHRQVVLGLLTKHFLTKREERFLDDVHDNVDVPEFLLTSRLSFSFHYSFYY